MLRERKKNRLINNQNLKDNDWSVTEMKCYIMAQNESFPLFPVSFFL